MKTINYAMLKSNIRFKEDQKDYIEDRKKLQTRFKFCVIVEADFKEIESLDYWLNKNIGKFKEKWNKYFYFKESYDYGYFEYFVSNSEEVKKIEAIIPDIYGIMNNDKKYKTNGYDKYREIE